jgi:hypothetical protein
MLHLLALVVKLVTKKKTKKKKHNLKLANVKIRKNLCMENLFAGA